MFISFLILFLMFCALSWYVVQMPDNVLDQKVLFWFQSIHVDSLTIGAKGLAVLGGLPITLVFVALILWYGYLKKDRFMLYFVACAVAITVVTTWLLKWSFVRVRPVVEIQLVETYGSSYPSAHSAYGMMMACILLYMSRSTRYRVYVIGFAILWFVLMGSSRIYVGAHYFTDVIAGWIWAGLIMLMVKMSLDRYGIKQTTN